MSEDIDYLKNENKRLAGRIKMLESPLELENDTIANISIEDLVDDVYALRIARINECEFVNGGMYMSLISKHFKEVQEGILMHMIGSRMASSIKEAQESGTATKSMIESLKDWNDTVLDKDEITKELKSE